MYLRIDCMTAESVEPTSLSDSRGFVQRRSVKVASEAERQRGTSALSAEARRGIHNGVRHGCPRRRQARVLVYTRCTYRDDACVCSPRRRATALGNCILLHENTQSQVPKWTFNGAHTVRHPRPVGSYAPNYESRSRRKLMSVKFSK
jgi:hypothetical protein